LVVSGLAVFFALIVGIPGGAWLGLKPQFRGRGFLVSLVNTGLSFPPVVMGLIFFMLFSRNGPFGELRLLYSVPAMVITQIFIAFPYVAAVAISATASVPRELRLQALGVGASRLQSVWLVIREARVSLMVAVIAGFGSVVSEVGAVLMVGGGIVSGGRNETRTLTVAIVQETRQGNFETAMAFGIILIAIAFTLNAVLTRLQQGAGGRWLQS
jgi:tungstate transport system permease protein